MIYYDLLCTMMKLIMKFSQNYCNWASIFCMGFFIFVLFEDFCTCSCENEIVMRNAAVSRAVIRNFVVSVKLLFLAC